MNSLKGFLVRAGKKLSTLSEKPAQFTFLGTPCLYSIKSPMSEIYVEAVTVGEKPDLPGNLDNNSIVCLLQGRIANRNEINCLLESSCNKSELTARDSDVILRLYEFYGIDAFRIISGYYVCVLFEGSKVIIVSGKTSGPSLYYRWDKESQEITISTEIKAIPAELRGLLPFESISEEMLYHRHDLTYFENILRLLPGHWMEIDFESNVITGPRLYYTPYGSINIFNEDQAALKIKSTLTDIVDNCSGDDIQCLISGGLDSSIVTYLANRRFPHIELYTTGTNESNEFGQAEVLAAWLGKKLNYILFHQEEFLSALAKLIYYVEHSFSTYLEYLVPVYISHLRLVGNGLPIISGYGSDVIFGGFAQKDTQTRQLAELIWSEYTSTYWANEMSPGLGDCIQSDIYYPYFDPSLVELSFGIDPYLKHKDGIEKYILRKAFAEDIDSQIVWRKKVGIHQGTGCENYFSQYLRLNGKNFFKHSIRLVKDRFAYEILKLVINDAVYPGDIDFNKLMKGLN